MKIVHNVQETSDLNSGIQLEKSILHTSSLIKKHQESILEKYAINISKYNILQLLYIEAPGSLSQNQIRERMTDKTLDLPRIVKQLTLLHYVKNVRQRNNRRISEVTITSLGIEVLKKIDQQVEQMNIPTTGIKEEEAKFMMEILQRISTTLTDYPQQIQMFTTEEKVVDLDKTVA